MDEKALRGLIADVKCGRLSRRSFVLRMVALGLTAPMATQMLAWSGLPAAAAEEKSKYKPTRRGGGGAEAGAMSSRVISTGHCTG